MTKAILFDADGVTINEGKMFSQRLSEEFSIPQEKIIPFFKNEYNLCAHGKADLKQVLPKYLKEWGWDKSVDDLLKYWFKNTKPENRVLDIVKKLRDKGIKCYLTSDQEKYRGEYISNNLGFNKYFDKCYFSCNIGYKKKDNSFYDKMGEYGLVSE